MNDKFFLDTNIFVYSFHQSSMAKLRQSTRLIAQAVTTRMGVVSYQVVQEFFHVALKRFATPMTPEEAEQYLSTVFRPLMTVNSSPALYGDALKINRRHRLSWYDSLIVAAALEAECGILYSEDLQNGQEIGNLRIQNPFL